MVPLRPGNAGGGKDPDFWRAFDGGEDEVIGGEPANTRTDPDPPAKAVSQGEGGAGLPLLPALRQDPSRGHPESRLRARPLQRGRAGGGRGHVRADRGGRAGGVAGRPARRPRREDVPARGGAAGDDPQARRRRTPARHPDHSGPGGPDRRQAGAGTQTRRMSGGKGSTRGTPPGGVASPLLSVIYMNRFLKHWRLTGRGEAFRAHVITYADDFVILSRGRAAEALAWTRAVVAKLGLMLNEAKTSVKDARRESFDFLGYTFGPQRYRKDGHWYLGASPSKRSVQRLKTKVGDLLGSGNKAPWPEVRDRLNRLLLGWSAYSATERDCRPTGRSTTTSTIVFARSCASGTRCKGAAQSGSPTIRSSERSACCAFDACTLGHRRVPRDEASRKAGCG